VRTSGTWADLPLRWVRPEHHVALGLACLNSRPHVGTPSAWADLPLRWVRPEHHVALGLACLNSRPHVGTPSAWAALPRTHSQTRAPRGET